MSTPALRNVPDTLGEEWPLYGIHCTRRGVLIVSCIAQSSLYAIDIASGEVELITSGMPSCYGIAVDEQQQGGSSSAAVYVTNYFLNYISRVILPERFL